MNAVVMMLAILCFSPDWVAALDKAKSELAQGNLTNAEEILNSTIDQLEQKSGHGAFALDEPLDVLAQVYQREKRFVYAAGAQQHRVDVAASAFGENAVVVGRRLGDLASAEQKAGDLDGAETASRRALAILTAAYTGQPPAGQAAKDLAAILMAENRKADDEAMLALAEKIFGDSLGANSVLAYEVRHAQPPEGVYKMGGAVGTPRILRKSVAEYTEEARKSNLQGDITVDFVIDPNGVPTQIGVLRPLGMGLDERAVAAIAQFRFEPTGKSVQASFAMTFRTL